MREEQPKRLELVSKKTEILDALQTLLSLRRLARFFGPRRVVSQPEYIPIENLLSEDKLRIVRTRMQEQDIPLPPGVVYRIRITDSNPDPAA